MIVIKKSKSLSKLIFEITDLSPKKFRFTIVSRMQNLSLDVVSLIYKANDTIVKPRIINDMDKSIDYLKNKFKKQVESLDVYDRNKLFALQLSRAIKNDERVSKRVEYSLEALTSLRQLDWMAELAKGCGCITGKQLDRIATAIYEVRGLLVGFIKSDRKRYNY